MNIHARAALLAVAAALGLTGCAHTADSAASVAFQDCDDCPQMVIVPAGQFIMGSEDGEAGRSEGPVAPVDIRRAFALAKTETTVAQFANFVAQSGYQPEETCRVWEDDKWQQSDQFDWRNPGPGVAYGDDYPVVCVSWRDAIAYAAWLSERSGEQYRLPTEAEWEYAALAGSEGPYSWGEAEDLACEYGNVFDRRAAGSFAFPWEPTDCDDAIASLAPVASYQASGFGVHDMIGNVWEWTQDCYRVPYVMRADRQLAYESESACERRTVRGGSWITRGSRLRPHFRGRDPEDAKMSYFGFRVARDYAAAQ